MKSCLSLIIFLLSVVSPLHSQVPPAYQASYNQMMKLQSFNNFQSFTMSMNMNFYGNGKISDMKFYFKIKMKDSSEKEVKSFLYFDTLLKQTYIRHVNKNLSKKDTNRNEKIYCSAVITVIAGTNLTNNLIPGIITDSCWLFNTLGGKINVYSIYPENYTNHTIAAVQFTNGNIEAFDPEKLKIVISGNEKALRRFNKKDFFAA